MTPASNPFEEEFCSVFEGLSNVHEYVEAYGNYTKNIIKKACDDDETVNECMDTHDPRGKMYTDVTSENRAWLWQVCTEYAYWQTGAPIWRPTIVSRKLNTSWFQRQCPLTFGEHEVPKRPIWREINREYDGWYVSLDRVFWIDGEFDPWREDSIQSESAPDRSDWEEDAEYVVLPKSVHHWVKVYKFFHMQLVLIFFYNRTFSLVILYLILLKILKIKFIQQLKSGSMKLINLPLLQ